MAEFCNKCINKVFSGEKPDIDIHKMSGELKNNTFIDGFICEGCGITSLLMKDNLYYALFYTDVEDLNDFDNIESLYKKINIEEYE